MQNKIKLKTGSPRTSAAILVEIPSEVNSAELKVESLENQSESFIVKVLNSGVTRQAEFALFLPGKYRLSAGTESMVIEVEQQKDVSFAVEMGLLSILVIIFLTGVIRWAQQKKKKLA